MHIPRCKRLKRLLKLWSCRGSSAHKLVRLRLEGSSPSCEGFLYEAAFCDSLNLTPALLCNPRLEPRLYTTVHGPIVSAVHDMPRSSPHRITQLSEAAIFQLAPLSYRWSLQNLHEPLYSTSEDRAVDADDSWCKSARTFLPHGYLLRNSWRCPYRLLSRVAPGRSNFC
jgi:hypothetical protein